MKKIIALLMAVAMVLSLVACGAKTEAPATEAAKADAPADKNTKTVKFNVPSVPEDAKVEVQLTARCNDGWFGCSGHIEMKKD